LMVSRVPYPHMTKQLLRGRGSHGYLVKILLVVGMAALLPEIALFAMFWGYALYFLGRYTVLRAIRSSSSAAAQLHDVVRQ
jgi:phosphatidylserine synthase